MVRGSLVKLFPCKFSLSKPLSSPIASGTSEILQKLRSIKIKNCRVLELNIDPSGRFVSLEHPHRSSVIRNVISLKLSGILTRFMQPQT
jgi:hypothetical protein